MNVAALLVAAVCIAGSGCASPSKPRNLPVAAPAVDLSPFRRVWIAGFLTSANSDIDVNGETVALFRRRLNPITPLRVVEAEPVAIRDEAELSDAALWRRLAEEYSEPLIVTGSVTFVPARPVAADSPSSRATYRLRQGFVLDTTLLFIDGRTGQVLVRHQFPTEKLYGSGQRVSTLSLYFELMDRVVSAFLRTFRSLE